MILECVANSWSPKIGDPNVLGWVIAISYIVAAGLTFLVLRQVEKSYSKVNRARIFWLGLTVMLVFLGLNKQLDLQILLRNVAKCHAIMQGWYEDRKEFKLIFVTAMAIGFLVLAVIIISFFRENFQKDKLALTGVIFLLIFILIHASYFYFQHFASPLIDAAYRIGLNWVLELIGISLISLQSLIRLRARQD